MATSLVTQRMSPELRARVEASVRGRRAAPGATLAPRAVSLLRFGALAMITMAISTVGVSWHRARQELEQERAGLLERVRRESTAVTPYDRAAPSRVQPWLERSAGPYTGDSIADELRTAKAFAATLRRPTIYVRGPLADFRSERSIAEIARRSFTDAFVLCLLDPPIARSEKALLGRARRAQADGKRLRQVTAHVERLQHALVGLPFLSPTWQARVESAESARELDQLRRGFERAPLASAKRAVKAELLLFGMDEPGEPNQPAELDGERPHHVRIGLVDLASDKLLFKLRRRVDPSWLSPSVRAEYASGIDQCALALDVRADVTAQALSELDQRTTARGAFE
jgi:hypothetical protein